MDLYFSRAARKTNNLMFASFMLIIYFLGLQEKKFNVCIFYAYNLFFRAARKTNNLMYASFMPIIFFSTLVNDNREALITRRCHRSAA